MFYPRTSPRALRATELAKYFAQQGHEVVSYACIGKYDYCDFETKTGVKVRNIPGRLFSKLESDGTGKYNVLDKVLTKIFANLLEWPDIELAFKMKAILRNENPFDLLISIAVPYPIHWGLAHAKKSLNKLFPKVWISDCGDPYMGNSVGRKKPKYFQKIEKYWAEKTDYITIPIEDARKAYPSFAKDKIKVIPQGFDFKSTPIDNYIKNAVPTFAFAGATYIGYRDPSKFLDYLCSLNFNFKFIVYSPPHSAFDKYIPLLKGKLEVRGYIPRPELIKELSKMDFLVNINNSATIQSPSKLIDYAITGRPILSISSYFTENHSFEDFIKGNYKDATFVNLNKYDINIVGQQFLSLFNNHTCITNNIYDITKNTK